MIELLIVTWVSLLLINTLEIRETELVGELLNAYKHQIKLSSTIAMIHFGHIY